ncbi:UNVERIFIED_CONTAM: hypothetical protein GTU68_022521 [Idotea baltica]|nr:hypothetical protein [Idotea baltica]
MVDHLGIEFTEVGDEYLIAKMPVDHRTKQPMGILHGGASAALAETLGSVAAFAISNDPLNEKVVGLEINANHIKSAKSGWVYGKVTAIKIGKTVQVWQIDITNEDQVLCCRSRLTTMTLRKN